MYTKDICLHAFKLLNGTYNICTSNKPSSFKNSDNLNEYL